MKHTTLLVTVFGVLIGVGLTLVFIGFGFGKDSNSLWTEVTKAGLQLLVVVVLGGLVTAAFNFYRHARERAEAEADANRLRRTELTHYRREKLKELVEITNVVRRAPTLIVGARSARTYGTEMRSLVDARASLSLLRHDIMGGIREAFSDGPAIVRQLQRMELYLGKLVKDYQDRYKQLSENQKLVEDRRQSADDMWKTIIATEIMTDYLVGANALPTEDNPQKKDAQNTDYDKEYVASHKKAVEFLRQEIWEGFARPDPQLTRPPVRRRGC